MTDDELIVRFETFALPDSAFHHLEHVQLARSYLLRYPLIEVLARMSAGLQAFAREHGKPDRFHATITWAYVFLVSERMARGHRPQTLEEFNAANADLLDWKNGILRRYYRDATLRSDVARAVFVLPDMLRE
jgi:hypothetical protein